MSITLNQIKSLGFKPSKRGNGLSKTRKYDTLVYPLNKTDFLYIGYSQFTKEINNKIIWKSFKQEDGNRITYPVVAIGDTSFRELEDYIKRSLMREQLVEDQNRDLNEPLPDPSEWESPEKDMNDIFNVDEFTVDTNNIPDGRKEI